MKISKLKLKKAVKDIILAIGEDPKREGLKETPERVAAMYAELFSGVGKDASACVKIFKEEKHKEMVIVKDIFFRSVCEHHFLPMIGKAHIAYIPDKFIITGLSKLARVVDIISSRPQIQERITTQIADVLMKKLKPLGVMVVIEAEHLCMSVRGANKIGAKTVTSALRGIFQKDQKTRQEAMSLIGK